MKKGATVLVVARWSSFRGRSGVVTQTRPFLMVQFEGEPTPLRIEEPSVIEVQPPSHVAGAE